LVVAETVRSSHKTPAIIDPPTVLDRGCSLHGSNPRTSFYSWPFPDSSRKNENFDKDNAATERIAHQRSGRPCPTDNEPADGAEIPVAFARRLKIGPNIPAGKADNASVV
jgi:hypothetical protein